jgi:hypothetical protein
LALIALVCYLGREGPAPGIAGAVPGSRRNFGSLPLARDARRNGPRERGRASADSNAAHHAVPIVVAATQIIGSGRAGREKDIFTSPGLDDDLGTFAIKRFGLSSFAAAKNVGAVNS